MGGKRTELEIQLLQCVDPLTPMTCAVVYKEVSGSQWVFIILKMG